MGVNAKTFDKSTWILLAIVAVALLVQKFSGGNIFNADEKGQDYVHALLTDAPLDYTRHGACRMECRNISKSEVKDILKSGTVNWQKSDEKDAPCPSYALEGNTKDGQQVRIVFADCENETRVITAIDLENEYDCICP